MGVMVHIVCSLIDHHNGMLIPYCLENHTSVLSLKIEICPRALVHAMLLTFYVIN